MSVALSSVVQVSQITLSAAPLPVAGAFAAIPGSPFTLSGQIVLGAPLPSLAVPGINGYGTATGLIGDASGTGTVGPPYVPPEIPTYVPIGGRPRPPRVRPVPLVIGRARVVGLLGDAEGEGVVEIVIIYARAVGLLGEATARGSVVQPTGGSGVSPGLPATAAARARVFQPVLARLTVTAPVSLTKSATGRVFQPSHALATVHGALGSPVIRAHVAAPPRWEREALWLLDVLDIEVLEDGALDPIPV